jgi:ABC-type branched-subunit amino acid transport system substrate-binding protein
VQLAVRDTKGDPVRAAQAVRELAGEGVIAIVGPIDRREAAAAARVAESLSVPLLALDVADGAAPQAGLFHALPTPASRAAALAGYAAARRVHKVAVVAPDNAYGRKQAKAFADAARAAGLQVVAEERYEPQTTSFGPLIKRLKVEKPDPAIFALALKDVLKTCDAVYYVGNDYELDIVPARKAGLRPVLVDRDNRYPAAADCVRITALTDLPGIVT